jgi:division protein CdvB (Snf7/Vps24/ESCRT-III family)
LVKKIIEEVQEVTSAGPDQVVDELADVQQALDDLIEKYGVSKEAIAQAQDAKNKRNGAFKKGVYIEHVDTTVEDKWTAYYRQNADRYPEIKGNS